MNNSPTDAQSQAEEDRDFLATFDLTSYVDLMYGSVASGLSLRRVQMLRHLATVAYISDRSRWPAAWLINTPAMHAFLDGIIVIAMAEVAAMVALPPSSYCRSVVVPLLEKVIREMTLDRGRLIKEDYLGGGGRGPELVIRGAPSNVRAAPVPRGRGAPVTAPSAPTTAANLGPVSPVSGILTARPSLLPISKHDDYDGEGGSASPHVVLQVLCSA